MCNESKTRYRGLPDKEPASPLTQCPAFSDEGSHRDVLAVRTDRRNVVLQANHATCVFSCAPTHKIPTRHVCGQGDNKSESETISHIQTRRVTSFAKAYKWWIHFVRAGETHTWALGDGGAKRGRQEEGRESARARGANRVLLMFLKRAEKRYGPAQAPIVKPKRLSGLTPDGSAWGTRTIAGRNHRRPSNM